MEKVIMYGRIGQVETELPHEEMEKQIEAFRATWSADFKDPELTYVLGNLRGFYAFLWRSGVLSFPEDNQKVKELH